MSRAAASARRSSAPAAAMVGDFPLLVETRPAGFGWQAEYGAFSLDAKRLAPHVAYVERQKEHHRAGTLIRALEPED